MSLELTLTDAGLTALAAAITAGTDFTIDSVEVGEGQYTPTSSATALDTPFSPVRVFTDPAGFVDENRMAFNFEDNGADAYDVGEIGVFSGTTLFAIGSQPSADGFIFSKAADTDLLVSVHTVVSGVADISAITFANTLLTNTNVDAGNIVSGTLDPDRLDSVPASTLTGTIHTDRIPDLSAAKITSGTLAGDRMAAATTSAPGAVERATNAEVDAGTEDTRYVTPAGVQRRINEVETTGFMRFSTSGTFTVPDDASVIYAEIIGGGGGGDYGPTGSTAGTLTPSAAYGGQGGERATFGPVAAGLLGTSITITVGSGGNTVGGDGGDSSFGTFRTAEGGAGESVDAGDQAGVAASLSRAGSGGRGDGRGNSTSDPGGAGLPSSVSGGVSSDLFAGGAGSDSQDGLGGGGGGGGRSSAGHGRDGGDGGAPGGGGGGGGGRNQSSQTRGDGGVGGRGEVRIWWW